MKRNRISARATMKTLADRCPRICRALVSTTTIRKQSTGGKKFYDSQSGSFITLPRSQGLRVHECMFQYTQKSANGPNGGPSDKVIIDHLREASTHPLISTVSLPNIISNDFDTYMSASIPYIRRNRSKLSVFIVPQIETEEQFAKMQNIVKQDASAKDVLEVETQFFLNKPMLLNNARAALNIVNLLPQLSAKGVTTRCNVQIDVDAIVSGSKDSLSVIEMGEVFARMCDLGVKVINICLVSKRIQRPGDLDEAAAEAVLDYLRELIEECLNLDVAGDPLLERLSVQCVHSALLPGLTELALNLGLTRLAVCGLHNVPHDSASTSDTESDGAVDSGSNDSICVKQLRDSEYKALVGSLYGPGGAHNAILPFLKK